MKPLREYKKGDRVRAVGVYAQEYGPGTVTALLSGYPGLLVEVRHDNGAFGRWGAAESLEPEEKPSVSPFMSGSLYSKGPEGETNGPSGNRWL